VGSTVLQGKEKKRGGGVPLYTHLVAANLLPYLSCVEHLGTFCAHHASPMTRQSRSSSTPKFISHLVKKYSNAPTHIYAETPDESLIPNALTSLDILLRTCLAMVKNPLACIKTGL